MRVQTLYRGPPAERKTWMSFLLAVQLIWAICVNNSMNKFLRMFVQIYHDLLDVYI